MHLILFLSFDSFVVSLALGLLVPSSQRRYRTCLLFGLCDGLATLVGPHLVSGSAVMLHSVRPWMLSAGICAWILFVGFLAHQIALKKLTSIFVISLLPLVLAIDNLFAGPISSGAVLTTNMAPVVAALLSTGFAVVGFAIGALLESHISRSVATGLAAILLCLTPILF